MKTRPKKSPPEASKQSAAAARERGLQRARDGAHKVLADFCVQGADDIRLERIAEANNAEIFFDDLEGATARVIQLAERARIFISTRITDPGSIRFSIAHELAHLLLRHRVQHGDPQKVIERVCSPLRADGTNPEREASVFASERLLPERRVRALCVMPPNSWGPVVSIAREFRVSLLAAAMRYVELTSERCAVVYSELGCVRWCKPSATFGAWIPKGRTVHPASAAFDYFDGGVIEQSSRQLDAGAWLSRRHLDGSAQPIVEHSTIVPELGSVFSLLWIPPDASAHLSVTA